MVNKVFDTTTLVDYAEENLGATVAVNPQNILISVEVLHPYGFMVAMPGRENPLGRLYSGRIDKFIMLHPLLTQGITYLGLWYDTESDNDRPWFIEESMWFEHYPHAMNYARYWGQQYIWNINGKNQLEVRS